MSRVLVSALSARRGGGITYIRNIAAAFPARPGNHLTIMTSIPIDGVPARPDIEVVQAPGWTVRPIWRFLFGALYFRFFWSRRHEFEIVYYAGGSFDLALPRAVRRVVAFRNMLPFDSISRRRYPPGWMRFKLWLLRYVQAWAFRKADLVIFLSDHAKRAVDAVVPKRRGRSVTIPHGASRTEAKLADTIVARLPERFVLYLSIFDVYKAQVELVEAWARMRRMCSFPERLVLAGPDSSQYGRQVHETIARLGLKSEVVVLGNVPHDQVSDLASRASLNLFLSSCENCPNILLELMAVGRPLLVADCPPMPEFGGPELDYVDPYDVDALAAAISRLLGDPERREALARAAATRADRYTWEGTGAATWMAILDLVRD